MCTVVQILYVSTYIDVRGGPERRPLPVAECAGLWSGSAKNWEDP